jgi:hypothetical protein
MCTHKHAQRPEGACLQVKSCTIHSG